MSERDYANAIRSIRASFAFFGYPLDDYSDAEIEHMVCVDMPEVVRTASMTVKEGSASLKRLVPLLGYKIGSTRD